MRCVLLNAKDTNQLQNLTSIFLILRKLGELTVIRLFDEDETEQTVENIKSKPFEKLGRIPARRNAFWKAAYSKALKELEEMKK